MPRSYTKIWIHAIWSTKSRIPLIHEDVEETIFEYVAQQLRELGCPVRIINGMPDHIHCLYLQNPQRAVTDVVKQIKGSSSHFINQTDLIVEKFAWQTGYGAFSVSEWKLEKIYHYIKNQKHHHLKKTFEEEEIELWREHNIEIGGEDDGGGPSHT
jgi:putative transposase